jgi:hypothetical protein
MKKSHFLLVVLIILSPWLSQAKATIIYNNEVDFDDIAAYDNYGPEYSTALEGWWFGTRAINPDLERSIGSSFIAQTGGRLNSLTLTIQDSYVSRTDEAFKISLYANPDGTLGTELWNEVFAVDLKYDSIFQVSGLEGPVLEEGTSYWLLLHGENLMPQLHVLANLNNIYSGFVRFSDTPEGRTIYYGDNTIQLAMRVGVTPVPEPTTLSIFAIGGILLFRKRRV